MNRRWGFGIGSIFTFIIVLFIYLFSRDKYRATDETGWYVLQLVTKWYLIISAVIIGLAILFVFLGLISALIIHLRVKRRMKKMDRQDVIEAEYRIKK